MNAPPPVPPPANRPNPFNPALLARSVIALPLLAELDAETIGRAWLAGFLKNPRFQRRSRARTDAAQSKADLTPAERGVRWLREAADGRTPEQVLRLLRQDGLAPPPNEEAAWLTWLPHWLLLREPGQAADPPLRLYPVIIDLNLRYRGGRDLARQRVFGLTQDVGATMQQGHRQALLVAEDPKNKYVQQYVFARLEGPAIRRLAERDAVAEPPAGQADRPELAAPRAIYRIWPDFAIGATVNKSIATVKADAAQVAYAALGEGLVWAVMDSGIQGDHPHFARHRNLDLTPPLQHTDFSGPGNQPLADAFGHGTHVAGIIAGEQRDAVPLDTPAAERTSPPTVRAYTLQRNEQGDTHYEAVPIQHISGIAPKCKLLSLKVLDDQGQGQASNLIAAIGLIQELNSHGRNLLVQGVNMSVGYEFEPEWFACGQSPLCVEVNRLVRSGVVVVVAAGNTGYGVAQSYEGKVISAGMAQTINDPGNADLAITVGSTHRDMPHVYGVSYFSSKGPTGDGRLKPDLVAPGEKIISCAAGAQRRTVEADTGANTCDYLEQSGTSMAAPHVSGSVAAFLSIRREFIGYPEKVKDLFVASATDLRRERYFQGAGLVDLMRAIQSV